MVARERKKPAVGRFCVPGPTSLGAAIGFGNARYRAGDLAGAVDVFRATTRSHPDAAPAWNNLAHVLADLGHRDEALAAARTAVRLGGAWAEIHRTTLREIEVRSPRAP